MTVALKWEGTFDAAHFIPGHPKCGRLHGHTYHVRVWLEGKLDSQSSYLVDYGAIRAAVQELDHRLLVATNHPTVQTSLSHDTIEVSWYDNSVQHSMRLRTDAVCRLPICETSAEHIAALLASSMGKRWNLRYVEVEVRETPRTGAVAEWTSENSQS